MYTLTIATASAAALLAVAALDASPAEARWGGKSFSAPRASTSMRSFSARSLSGKSFTSKSLARTKTKTLLSAGNKTKLSTLRSARLKNAGKLDKVVLKKGPMPKLGQGNFMKLSKAKLASLPKQKAMNGKMGLVGRLAVPKNLKPKLALGLAPKPHMKHAFAPFLQRPWRRPFFWVAVAGLGYLTVPQLYYDRFYACTNVPDPDYDECARILSYAVIEEEEYIGRARYPMPAEASYRYRAKAEPTQEARQACSLEPFVERKWNREFVWVEIPKTGNVTVPEDVYEAFHGKIEGEKPDYTGACKVLVEAAAADTVVATTGPDLNHNL